MTNAPRQPRASIISRLPVGLMATFVIALVIALCTVHRSASSIPSRAAADTTAYNLGAEHALRLILSSPTAADIDFTLLDVRARETNIATRVSREAADAYVAGFEDKIREMSDSLARELF